MATKARQQYFADEISLQKQRREFSLEDNIKQKIDSVETGAQVNTIETVKVNGTALTPDANKAVNVLVPDVIDNLYSTSTDDALSAKQGKVLYDYLQNIASRGRFLSNWNCATGLPVTNPTTSPYTYMAGDYYSISNVASGGGTNYRPDGSSYTIGQASTTIETEEVNVSDFYLYDGTNWLLLVNTARQIAVDSSLSTTSTNPVENRVVTNAINAKVGVSADSGNDLLDGAKLRIGTESDFSSIVSPDSNTMYIQYVTSSPTPPSPGRQPTANTIGWWKLDGDLTDEMQNYDGTATSGATVTYEALPGDSNIQCVKLSSSSFDHGISLSSNMFSERGTQQTSFTFAGFCKRTGQYAYMFCSAGNNSAFLNIACDNQSHIPGGGGLNIDLTGQSENMYNIALSDGAWHNIVWAYDHTTRIKSFYVDGQLAGTITATTDYTIGSTGTTSWLARINNNLCMSNMVFETNVAWDSTRVQDFYDTFKSLYGLS